MTTALKFRTLALLFAIGTATLAVGSGCHGGPATVMAELGEANRLAADLRVQFNKAADASNRAVMAETDETSIAFANEAQQTSAAVDRDVAALSPLLHTLGLPDEIQVLDQFGQRLSSYRDVDRTVLALAVENTNLKAQRLSFGAARDAADHFKATLVLAPDIAAKDRCRGETLVGKALLAVRELQTLQGPHIASSDEAAMTAMEQQMAALEAATADALTALSGLVEPSALSAAQADFTQFKSIGSQIVALSRRNSNVRSLDLSLRVKPPLTAACDDSLRTLQQALASKGSKATR
ncbi:MAG TPA: hypothetical protein VK745_04610 [Polyangiaceae bacterium]|jgi:hypothetical protein|nr:hypothetical protein [Polyangiaceae bacterium]